MTMEDCTSSGKHSSSDMLLLYIDKSRTWNFSDFARPSLQKIVGYSIFLQMLGISIFLRQLQESQYTIEWIWLLTFIQFY